MDNSEEEFEDDVNNLAKKLYRNDHPNGIWGIEAIPRKPEHPSGKRVSVKEKEKYREMAQVRLEAERDE